MPSARQKMCIRDRDYTSDEIMLVADNDLYVINTKDGKDKIEPKMCIRDRNISLFIMYHKAR